MPTREYRTDRLLVVDVELTAWPDGLPPGEEVAVVEFGVAEVDNRALEIVRAASLLVRPCRASISRFFTELTGITPEEVRAEGRPLEEVCRTLRKEFGTTRKTWVAWGDDDAAIRDACRRDGVPHPFSPSFVDLSHLYGLLVGTSRRLPLSEALAELGLAPEGRRHRARDDAVDAARLWIELVRRGRAGPFPRPAHDGKRGPETGAP